MRKNLKYFENVQKYSTEDLVNYCVSKAENFLNVS